MDYSPFSLPVWKLVIEPFLTGMVPCFSGSKTLKCTYFFASANLEKMAVFHWNANEWIPLRKQGWKTAESRYIVFIENTLQVSGGIKHLSDIFLIRSVLLCNRSKQKFWEVFLGHFWLQKQKKKIWCKNILKWISSASLVPGSPITQANKQVNQPQQGEKEPCSLIISPYPQGIWKQPKHDSANWLCWLDIHHVWAERAKEQTQPATVVQKTCFLTAIEK